MSNTYQAACVDLHIFQDKSLEVFVTTKSMSLFKMMEFPVGFLTVDPVRWEQHDDFKHAADTVAALKLVNDQTKRIIDPRV